MQTLEQTYKEQVGYNTENGSDKEYRIGIIPLGEGRHGLRCYNGPRGRATSKAQYKDFESFDEARNAAEKFKREKTKGHYIFGSADPNQTPIATYNRVDTGLRPQLLNAITPAEAESLVRDDAWLSQRKYNGENLIIDISAQNVVTYSTKDGYSTTVPQGIDNAVRDFGESTLCTEILGDRCAVFDILSHRGRDLRETECLQRIRLLNALFANNNVLFAADSAETTNEKCELNARITADDGEGTCYKLKSSVYEPGKPSKDGPQRKCKAWKSANFIVVAHNEKRSVRIAVQESGNTVEVGNVTITTNKPVPAVGATIEVRYLDYFPGGAVTQTGYLHERLGMEADDCPISQLRSLARER